MITWQKATRWLYPIILMMLLGTLLASCRTENNVETRVIVVTEIAVVAGEPQIVTRLVEETVVVTATPQPSVAVPQPVVLDLAYLGIFPNIDPQQTVSDTARHLIENLFVGLTNFNHETQQIEPELARSWEVDSSGTVWTFYLRDDVFWTKGVASSSENDSGVSVERVRPVVAEDVVTAVKRACAPEPATPDTFTLFIIEGCQALNRPLDEDANGLATLGVQAIDDYTVQFNLTEPAGYFPTLTAMPMMMPVPTEVIEEFGDEWKSEQTGLFATGWQTAANLITSGPFFPTPREEYGLRLTLNRNPEWPFFRQGNVDIVNILFMDDQQDIFKGWQAKSLDVSPLAAADYDGLVSRTPQKVRLVPDQTVFYAAFNYDSGVFRELNVRQAFAAAIDREQLVAEVYGPTAQGIRHLTPSGVFGAPAIDEVGVGYSPDWARLKMAESGFRSCRLLPPFTILVSSADLSLLQAEIMRDMWVQELGCVEENIIIEQAQFGTLLARTRQDAGIARPDMWELGWSSYYPDAHNWLHDLVHCQNSENRQNRPCSPADDLIMQAATTSGPAERAALYREIEKVLFEGEGEMPLIPLYVRGNLEIVQTWLTHTPASFGGEQFDRYAVDHELKRLERSR